MSGGSLASALDQSGPLEPKEAARLVEILAHAIEAAHPAPCPSQAANPQSTWFCRNPDVL